MVHDFDNCNDTDMDIRGVSDISPVKPAVDLEATMCSANPQEPG